MKHISDLLSQAVGRANISRQVSAAQVVDTANEWLETVLPEKRKSDACAMSLRNGNLIVACLSSSIADFIRDREEDCLNHVKRSNPNAQLDKLCARLVSELQSHEF